MTLAIVLTCRALAHDIRHLLLVHWPNLLSIFARECTLLQLESARVGVRATDIEIVIIDKWVHVVTCCA